MSKKSTSTNRRKKGRDFVQFVEMLERLMRESNVTQYKLSKDTGIAQSAISRWRNGKVTPSTDAMHTLAVYFGIPLSALLGEDDEKAPAQVDERDIKIALLSQKH